MKKLVSILIIAVMLLSVTVVPAFAYENLSPGDYLYEDKFLECIEGYMNFEDECYGYEEIYYHHIDENDPQSDIDWVYVNGFSNVNLPWMAKRVVADRVFYKNSGSVPFDFGCAIFDVSKDAFVDITDETIGAFNGLAEMLEELKIGTPIGDADCDDELSILDATHIQLVAAKIFEYDPSDDISYYHNLGERELSYISDADLDGERSIMDATAIQLKLAGLDNEPVDDEEFIIYTLSDYNERWNLPYMSDDATLLSFEMEYDKQQFSDVVYNYEVTGEYYTLAIIKSNEQFNTLFNDRAPKYDDEFFETKWLVMAMTRCGCHQAKAPITDVAVSSGGDTLYVRANIYVPDGPVSPTEPMWLSMVSIDKSELLNVKNIAKVK